MSCFQSSLRWISARVSVITPVSPWMREIRQASRCGAVVAGARYLATNLVAGTNASGKPCRCRPQLRIPADVSPCRDPAGCTRAGNFVPIEIAGNQRQSSNCEWDMTFPLVCSRRHDELRQTLN
jgi:hypothetical protein